MKTFAPELSALMTILALVGPVISTRRSSRSAGIGADRPVAFADVARFVGKVGQLARVEPLLPLDPRRQQLAAAVVEALVQLGEEAQRLVGQHLVRAGQRRRRRHGPRPVENRAHRAASCVMT